MNQPDFYQKMETPPDNLELEWIRIKPIHDMRRYLEFSLLHSQATWWPSEWVVDERAWLFILSYGNCQRSTDNQALFESKTVFENDKNVTIFKTKRSARLCIILERHRQWCQNTSQPSVGLRHVQTALVNYGHGFVANVLLRCSPNEQLVISKTPSPGWAVGKITNIHILSLVSKLHLLTNSFIFA